jgi:flagellar hook-length control protein FliK
MKSGVPSQISLQGSGVFECLLSGILNLSLQGKLPMSGDTELKTLTGQNRPDSENNEIQSADTYAGVCMPVCAEMPSGGLSVQSALKNEQVRRPLNDKSAVPVIRPVQTGRIDLQSSVQENSRSGKYVLPGRDSFSGIMQLTDQETEAAAKNMPLNTQEALKSLETGSLLKSREGISNSIQQAAKEVQSAGNVTRHPEISPREFMPVGQKPLTESAGVIPVVNIKNNESTSGSASVSEADKGQAWTIQKNPVPAVASAGGSEFLMNKNGKEDSGSSGEWQKQALSMSAGNTTSVTSDLAEGAFARDNTDLSAVIQDSGKSDINRKGAPAVNGEQVHALGINRQVIKGAEDIHILPRTAEMLQELQDRGILTKKDDTSLRLSLEPEGMGKLEINLSLQKGVIHGNINAYEQNGKEFMEKGLYTIMETLTREGLNIGNFSVSLRDRKNEFPENDMQADTKQTLNTDENIRPVRETVRGQVSIFV